MAWTTAHDVEARWLGDQPLPEPLKIDAWIADAETVVLNEFPDIAERITAETLSLDTVRMVVCSMVLRVLRNPDRVRVDQLGPSSRTFAGDDPGGLHLTDDERALLAATPSTSRGLWALSTTRGDLETRRVVRCAAGIADPTSEDE